MISWTFGKSGEKKLVQHISRTHRKMETSIYKMMMNLIVTKIL